MFIPSSSNQFKYAHINAVTSQRDTVGMPELGFQFRYLLMYCKKRLFCEGHLIQRNKKVTKGHVWRTGWLQYQSCCVGPRTSRVATRIAHNPCLFSINGQKDFQFDWIFLDLVKVPFNRLNILLDFGAINPGYITTHICF